MERIVYRKTLDVHKNGIQFMLRGFETADKLSRVIEVSLMASGDAIDFPLSEMVAMMYVTTPSATEPSINECIIKDNKVVYEALPITEEGITTMQLKLIETSPEGATSVLVSPSFAVEVIKSNVDDSGAVQKTTFTALEDAVAKAKSVYDARFLRMELTNDCIFKAYYADGTEYETDILKKLFYNGNVLLSESYAHGNTGTRIDEDTDNSMYYSKVSESEALNAKRIMEESENILEEIKLHGVYTAFKVNFETGEVEYVSPSFSFKVNADSGELDAIGQAFSFDDEIGRLVNEWLIKYGADIETLKKTVANHGEQITNLSISLNSHKEEVTPIAKGGTGADNAEKAKVNLGIVDSFEVKITTEGKVNPYGGTIDTNYEEIRNAIARGKRVFARFYKTDGTRFYECEFPLIRANSEGCLFMGGIDYNLNPYRMEYSDEISERFYYIKIGTDSSVSTQIKPLGGACVVHGHYVGNGESVDNGDGTYTYYGVGEDSPNYLSFDFEPKLVFIWWSNQFLLLTRHDTEDAPDESNYDAYMATFDIFNGKIDVANKVLISKSFDGGSVSWYAYSSINGEVKPSHQMNEAGRFYEYIAIG